MARSLDELAAAYGGPAAAPAGAAPASGPRSLDQLASAYAPPEEDKPEPSLLEAGLRGVKQGVTFGFGDELTGALESAFTSKTYKQSRDEARAADKSAGDAHPIGYGLGEILGGIAVPVPGVGLLGSAAKGASLGARFAVNAAKGAGAGIIAGAGNSEATDIAGIAKDTAKSGLVGATLGGILGTTAEKYVHGAEGRADKQVLQEVTGGRATSAGKNVNRNPAEVLGAVKKFNIEPNASQPAVAAEKAGVALKDVGSKIGDVYAATDALSPGIARTKVTVPLEQLATEYRKNPARRAIADAIDKQVKNVNEAWGETVPSKDVHEFTSALGDAFEGSGLSPGAARKAERKVWGAVKDVLNDHVESVLPDRAPELRELNKSYQGLKLIRAAALDRAGLPEANQAAGGLRNIAGHGVKALSVAASLASGNPLPVLATHVAAPLAKFANRAATVALAKVSAAARAGQLGPKLIQEALTAGVPRGTIEATLAAFGPGRHDQEEATP